MPHLGTCLSIASRSPAAGGGGDATAPTLQSATVDETGLILTLVFDEAVTVGSGGSGGCQVNSSDGNMTPAYASGDGTDTLLYDLPRLAYDDETLTLDYTQPGDGIEDASGNDLEAISGAAVTNDSGITPIAIDAMFDLHAGTAAGTVVDATNLAANIVGSGISSPSVSNSPLSMATYVDDDGVAFEKAVRVGGALKYGAASSAIKYEHTTGSRYWRLNFDTGHARVSGGFFFKSTMGDGTQSFQTFDFGQLKADSGKDAYLGFKNYSSLDWLMQLETTISGVSTGGTIFHPLVANTWYWCAFDFEAGVKCSMSVYRVSDKQLMGAITDQASDSASVIQRLMLGCANNSANSGYFTTFGNVVLDWTNFEYPILPWAA